MHRVATPIFILLLFVSVSGQTKGTLNISAPAKATLNIQDFGATGDGVTDDAPALQSALEALNTQGGGTLIIPPGKYAIRSEVFNNFGNPGVSKSIVVRGAGTASQLLVKSGAGSTMWTLQNVAVTIDNLSFVGTEGNNSDARVTVYVLTGHAEFRNSRFIGIATGQHGDGAVVKGFLASLAFEGVNFGGCTGHSGVGTPVVSAASWNDFTMNGVSFVDYGTIDGVGLSKTTQAGYAWVYLKEPEVASANNRAFVDIRNVVMDEGAQFGLRIESNTGRISSVNVENLKVNGSFLGSAVGVYINNADKVRISGARFGHNQSTSNAAVKLVAVGNATLEHLLANESLTNRIDADADTKSLTIIESDYAVLNSQAKETRVIKDGKFAGFKTTGQIVSDVADAAPFVVASRSVVENLNASLLDGKASTDFALANHLHDGEYLKVGQAVSNTEVSSTTGSIIISAPSQVVFGNATAQMVVVVLPFKGNGPYTVKKTDPSVNPVQVNPSWATSIEGKSLLRLSKQNDYVVLARDGGVWRVIGGNVQP
jgi:hypothetical protein